MHDRIRRPWATSLLAAAACAAPPPTPPPAAGSPAAPPFELHAEPADAEVAERLLTDARVGRERIEAFFGAPFAAPVRLDVLPDRAAFTAWFPAEWGMGETACWMVASGVADRLAVLSPRVWAEEACEHDPADPQHVRDLVVHELVHVYHGQHNPTGDFVGAESVGWFAEGLAVHVSGQLERGHRDRAREAVATGALPASLETAWSGPYRYGVCGTLVEVLDERAGRDALLAMLAATETEELLALAGLEEAELLELWRAHAGG